MAGTNRLDIIKGLHVTIEALEKDSEIPSADADLATLKTILRRRIVELEREDELAVSYPSDER